MLITHCLLFKIRVVQVENMLSALGRDSDTLLIVAATSLLKFY